MIFTIRTTAVLACLGAVVDELHVAVAATCALALKQLLACGYISQKFSPVRAVFGAPVPWMCPGTHARQFRGGAVSLLPAHHQQMLAAVIVTVGAGEPAASIKLPSSTKQ
jgi:hypothetical protein